MQCIFSQSCMKQQKDKQLLFYEWHVQKASEKNCKDCWFTSGVSMPMDQGNTI